MLVGACLLGSPGLEKPPMTCHTAGSAIWFLLQLLTTVSSASPHCYIEDLAEPSGSG